MLYGFFYKGRNYLIEDNQYYLLIKKNHTTHYYNLLCLNSIVIGVVLKIFNSTLLRCQIVKLLFFMTFSIFYRRFSKYLIHSIDD